MSNRLAYVVNTGRRKHYTYIINGSSWSTVAEASQPRLLYLEQQPASHLAVRHPYFTMAVFRGTSGSLNTLMVSYYSPEGQLVTL